MEAWTDQALATLLLSLRIAPTLAFAPPFTLVRIPALVRVMLAVASAAWLVAGHPEQTWLSPFRATGLVRVAALELVLGIALALSLQIAFAALQTVGRTIDIQAGYGMAMLIDPTTRAQVPLAGTILAYAAGAVFFAIDGPADLFAIWSTSLDRMPLGSAGVASDASLVLGYIGGVFVMALGLAGLILLALFLLDLTIAYMSRTMPQMNVMMLGFQVKAIAMLATLPIAIAGSAGLFVQILRYALENSARAAGG